MLNQALFSILIGAGISAVAFVPLLIHQFRRFGAPSPARMVLAFTNFVYVTALIAYTIFPVPHLSQQYCAAHPRQFIIDPTTYFRDMHRDLAGASLTQVLTSSAMLQMVLNVALFVPLGFYFRRLLRWRPVPSVLAGFATSLLIEVTQYTGNWFLAPCQYRVADINDLLTNTLGTIIGVLVAAVGPTLGKDPATLEKEAGEPRPVTRGRRLLALVIDAWWMAVIVLMAIGCNAGVGIVMMLMNSPDHNLTPGQNAALRMSGQIILAVAEAIYVIIAAAGRLGVSPGMGTAHLAWVDRTGRPAGTRHSLVIGVCLMVATALPTSSLALGSLAGTWLFLELVSIPWTARGLTSKIMGLELVDARTVPAKA